MATVDQFPWNSPQPEVRDRTIDDLDLIGVLEGTDKSSSVAWSWDYLRHYQHHFAQFREAPINLIEIGIAGGSSLRMWRSWFTRATIVGVDVDPDCRRHAMDRVQVEIGSQDDPGFLANLVQKYPPTIIIDDGSHQAHHIIFTFERLFPSLLSGGIYVIEDVAFHFGAQAENWKGVGGFSVPKYFSRIIDSCLARTSQDADNWGMPKFLVEHVDSVTVIPSALLIQRKTPRRSAVDAIRFAASYQTSGSLPGTGFARLIAYFLRQGNVDAAEQAAQRAIELGALTNEFVHPLADLRERQERFAEGADILFQAANANSTDAWLWERLASFAQRSDQYERAATAYRNLMILRPSYAWYPSFLGDVLEKQGRLKEAITAAERAVSLAEKEWERGRFSTQLAQMKIKADTGGAEAS